MRLPDRQGNSIRRLIGGSRIVRERGGRKKRVRLQHAPAQWSKAKARLQIEGSRAERTGGLTKAWIAGDAIVAYAGVDAASAEVQIVEEVEDIDADLELGILA
jgi:hypothetical protein